MPFIPRCIGAYLHWRTGHFQACATTGLRGWSPTQSEVKDLDRGGGDCSSEWVRRARERQADNYGVRFKGCA
eukprot:1115359-Pyramimonas_sp.AAC.1